MKRNAALYIKVAAGVVITAALFIFAFMPLYSSVSDLKNSIHKENVTLEKNRQTQNDFSSLAAQYEEIKENSESLGQAFLEKKTSTILETIESIEAIATNRRITQTLTIDPIPEPTDTTTLTSSVKLMVQGTSDGIFLFLKDLEDLPYYISIESVDFSKQTTGIYDATLEGTIYWL